MNKAGLIQQSLIYVWGCKHLESREEAKHIAEYIDYPGQHVGGNYPPEHGDHFSCGRIYAVGRAWE